MSRSRNIVTISLLSVAVCCAFVSTGFTTDTAEVTRAEGRLQRMATMDGSPIPMCWIFWEHEAQAGNEFSATLTDYFPHEICGGELMARCGADTLAYSGWWPQADVSDIGIFRSMFLQGWLEIELTVTAPTVVTAARQWSGDLVIARHEVTLTTPDGASIPLLPAETPPDTARMVLDPGVHELRIDLDIGTFHHELGAYAGSVTLTWADATTSSAATSWGTLKALYR
jgi:hypothetical protein